MLTPLCCMLLPCVSIQLRRSVVSHWVKHKHNQAEGICMLLKCTLMWLLDSCLSYFAIYNYFLPKNSQKWLSGLFCLIHCSWTSGRIHQIGWTPTVSCVSLLFHSFHPYIHIITGPDQPFECSAENAEHDIEKTWLKHWWCYLQLFEEMQGTFVDLGLLLTFIVLILETENPTLGKEKEIWVQLK